ncbi:MAG: hypothetical protein ACKVH8_11155 [Pirellulales bacterium]|jgi:hypothetical protein
MKKNRHKLTSLGYSLFVLIVAILPMVWVSWGNGQAQSATTDSIYSQQNNHPPLSESEVSHDSVDSSVIADFSAATGQQPTNNGEAVSLLNQVTSRLSHHQSIEAKLHTETFGIFKTSVNGQGEYFQSGLGEELRVHLALNFGSKNSPMKMVQTTSEDRKYLWSSCKTPFIEQATRIDLERVKTALKAHPQTALSSGPISQISIAGFPGMIAELINRFDFTEVEAGHVNERPVWIVRGKINHSSLARILEDESIDWGGTSKDLAKFDSWNLLPHHLPHQVVIAVGQEDLIPYRIDFRKFTNHIEGELPHTSADSTSPLVSISLSSVQLDQSIDPANYNTPLDIENWKDDTVRYISSLTGSKPLASAQ